MPSTRGKAEKLKAKTAVAKQPANSGSKAKVGTITKVAKPVNKLLLKALVEEEKEEDAYDRLLQKVNKNRTERERQRLSAKQMEPQAGVSNEVELNPPQQDRVISNMEEEMVMEVGTADVRRTFPSEEEDDMECEESSQNNNATVTVENE